MPPLITQVKRFDVDLDTLKNQGTRTRGHEDDLEPIYNFYKQFPKDNQHHVKDLHTTYNHKPQVLVVIPSLTYVVYIHRVLKNVITTLVFEWTMPIFHPINFLLLVTVFPTLIIAIIVLEFALNIGYKFGLEDLIQRLGTKYTGRELSIVNWWDPRMFGQEVNGIVQDGIKALNAPLPPPMPERQLDDSIFGVEGTIQHRSFHIDVAELLLFMSSVIYERNDNLVRKAHKLMDDVVKKNKKNVSVASEDINFITKALRDSESRIHKQAAQWGLNFTSLSELNSLGGPFSGMFWSNEYNFIVVVFKGTTPSNFEDFVVDLMFQRVDARGFVFGEVHEGFYSSLFPQHSNDMTRSSRSSPYISMVRAIRAKAADIIESREDKEDVKINVWVTGHSLGAALASLFYTRLMKSSEDLGPNCVLRDGYMFGSPSIGDADFAAEFASHSNNPYDKQNTLWRIIDDTDIITKLPPGWNDPSIRRLVDKSSILNYVHIGEGIRFFQNGKRPVSTRNLFTSGKEPVIVEHTGNFSVLGIFNWYGWRSGFAEKVLPGEGVFSEYKHNNILDIVENLLPTFFRNHLPARYFSAMEKARIYFDGLTPIEEEGLEGSMDFIRRSDV